MPRWPTPPRRSAAWPPSRRWPTCAWGRRWGSRRCGWRSTASARRPSAWTRRGWRRRCRTTCRAPRATDLVEFDRKVPIIVRLPEEARRSAQTLEQLRVDGVPLRELVRVYDAAGPSEIRRMDQGRVVTLHADVASGGVDAAVARVQAALARHSAAARADGFHRRGERGDAQGLPRPGLRLSARRAAGLHAPGGGVRVAAPSLHRPPRRPPRGRGRHARPVGHGGGDQHHVADRDGDPRGHRGQRRRGQGGFHQPDAKTGDVRAATPSLRRGTRACGPS